MMMLLLSRTARRPLQARLATSSALREVRSPNIRQFSNLSSRIHPASRWTTPKPSLSLSRPSIGLRASSIPLVRYSSTDASAPPEPFNSDPPPSDVDLAPTTSFTEDAIDAASTTSPGFFEKLNPLTVPEISATVDHPPDTIGYLASLGLENGFGPTGLMQWILEHIHVLTGLPWWASVSITAVALRFAFLPVFVRVSDNTTRTKELQPLLAPIIIRQRQALLAQDIMAQQQIRKELMAMYKKVGVNPMWAFGSLAQIPFQIGAFFIIRQMAYLPVPGLDQAGIWWFTDLTSADPFFILPLVSSGFMYLSLRAGAADLPSGQSATVMKYLRIGLPLLSLGITATFPSILTLHFAISSVLSYLQAIFLRDPRVRSWLGIYPLSNPSDLPTPLQSQNLSADALSRIIFDQKTIEAEKEKAVQATKGGMFNAILGSKGGVADGIKEQMRKSREEQEYKEYEKRAKEEEKARGRSRGRRV
ncbi:hypothetical protein ABW19_dt0204206 [Dactylella cylindrospora]|nr:hypothetical protein ABW19_dt0204206 [Dactylella cylindrospora]